MIWTPVLKRNAWSFLRVGIVFVVAASISVKLVEWKVPYVGPVCLTLLLLATALGIHLLTTHRGFLETILQSAEHLVALDRWAWKEAWPALRNAAGRYKECLEDVRRAGK